MMQQNPQKHLQFKAVQQVRNKSITRMWAIAQRDGRHAEYRWRPLFNTAEFG